MSVDRVDSLDWQRGLLASAIMVFHLVSWEIRPLDADDVLGRLGIYGVAMFFVLSGLSMAMVYAGRLQSPRQLGGFFVGRFCRIWPLLWVCVLAVVASHVAAGRGMPWAAAAMTATTAFAFVNPGSYLVAGAWSIGNEMVYYALTPLILWAYDRRPALGNIVTVGAILGSFAYTGEILTTDAVLQGQKAAYAHPASNLFMYSSGVALYYNFRDLQISRTAAYGVLLVSLALFTLIPAQGDLIHIIAGPYRMGFAIASVGFVLFFYKFPFDPHRTALSATLSRLGTITYGIYLLHPFAYRMARPLVRIDTPIWAPLLTMLLTVALTLAMALATYRFIEAPAIRWGRRVGRR